MLVGGKGGCGLRAGARSSAHRVSVVWALYADGWNYQPPKARNSSGYRVCRLYHPARRHYIKPPATYNSGHFGSRRITCSRTRTSCPRVLQTGSDLKKILEFCRTSREVSVVRFGKFRNSLSILEKLLVSALATHTVWVREWTSCIFIVILRACNFVEIPPWFPEFVINTQTRVFKFLAQGYSFQT